MTLARSIALGLWLISADAAAQLLPPALPWLSPRSPALWLGLDAGVEPAASADAAVDNPHAVIAAALTAWLQAPSSSARPWPADGVRIGVLADRSSSQLDRALLIEMWTASAYGDYRRTQGG